MNLGPVRLTSHSDRSGRDIICARCGYSLAGLATGACPECGSKFSRDDSASIRAEPDYFRPTTSELLIASLGGCFAVAIVVRDGPYPLPMFVWVLIAIKDLLFRHLFHPMPILGFVFILTALFTIIVTYKVRQHLFPRLIVYWATFFLCVIAISVALWDPVMARFSPEPITGGACSALLIFQVICGVVALVDARKLQNFSRRSCSRDSN